MSNEHQLRSTAAHCLAILQRYHDGERTVASKGKMAAEVEAIIGCLMELDLPSGATEAGVLKPVEGHLLAQYGHEAGRSLYGEFYEVFERTGMPLIQIRFDVR